MSDLTSYCGLECGECPAYIATRKGDRAMLEEVAADWSRRFGIEVPVESIPCDGCVSGTDRICGYCETCAVRACASKRGVGTCADCEDYGCATLKACPAYQHHGRQNLERLRAE